MDPGGDVDRILWAAAEAGVEIEKVLFDTGTHRPCGRHGQTGPVAWRAHRGAAQDDQFWIDGLPMQRRYFDFPEVGAFVPGCWLDDAFATGGTRSLRGLIARGSRAFRTS